MKNDTFGRTMMISVEQADKIISALSLDYGNEVVSLENASGRILAQDIKADRDFPPFNRVTMDGIAVSYVSIEKGIKKFNIRNVQAAGEVPVNKIEINECVEIMTGAALPSSTDTVICY